MCRPVHFVIFTFLVILSVTVLFSCQRYIAGHQRSEVLHREVRDVVDDVHNIGEGTTSTPSPQSHRRRGKRERKELKAMKGNITELQEKVSRMEKDLRSAKRYVSEQQRGGKCRDALCPTGAIKFGCSCYMFVLHQKMKWEAAREYCQNMGGYLLYIDSEGVSRSVKRFCKANLGRKSMRKVNFYTGLIHTTSEHNDPVYLEQHRGAKRADGWYWQRGNFLKSRQLKVGLEKYWGSKQPATHADGQEDPKAFLPSCMMLNGTETFRWYSVYCTQEHHFICEWRATPIRRKRNKKNKNSDGEEEKSRTKRDTKGDQRRRRDYEEDEAMWDLGREFDEDDWFSDGQESRDSEKG